MVEIDVRNVVVRTRSRVSVLNREPMWLKSTGYVWIAGTGSPVSVLNREPMWLKSGQARRSATRRPVSVLNREPMWLKS